MQTYKLFIGANNITGEVELDLIELTLNKYFDGYTIEDSVGYWLGKRENNVLVTLTSEPEELEAILVELKEILKQDAIAYQILSDLQFM